MPFLHGPQQLLKGQITISRTQHTTDPDEIVVQIVDDRSGCVVVEARMGLENFAYAITGHAAIDCQLERYPNAPIGKYPHHKTENVVIDESLVGLKDRDREQTITKALAPYETDGWKGNRRDIGNGHRSVPLPPNSPSTHHCYRVGFVRYRDEPQPEEEKNAALQQPRAANAGPRNRRKR